MQLTEVVNKMGRNDARIIQRDTFLLMLFSYGFLVMVVMRLALPPLANALANAEMAFDLTPYYPLIVSGLVLHQAAAVLTGTVTGFMLIDERDMDTLTAIMVTPVPMRVYLLYKVILPTVLGAVMGFVGLMLLGPLTVNIVAWQMLILALVNGLLSAVITLALAGFSANKVAGFATVKVMGSLMLLVIGAWFMPGNWEFLMGFYPPYWTMKAYWAIEAGVGPWPLYVAIAIVTHLIVLAYLIQHFKDTVYEG